MSDFAPPTGPPPPKVPEGWKAVWNAQYSEWFYVNLYTKESTWEKPTEPAVAPGQPAPGAPPLYSPGGNAPVVSDQKTPLESNNPYSNGSGTPFIDPTQSQEANRGQADNYYGAGGPLGQQQQGAPPLQQQGSYDQNQLPPRPADRGSKGLFSKLLGRSNKQSGPPQGMMGGYPQQGGYGSPGPGYGPPQGQYGGYPQGPGYGPPPGQYGGYGGYPQQGYGQPMMGGYPPQGYPPQQYGRPGRRPGGGLGAGGGAALGLGGGLLGGMMLGNMINDGEQDAYQDGYQDGADDGGGGDFDGGD